jgi:hypothetical protein
MKSWDERLEHFITLLPSTNHSTKHLKSVGASVYTRLKALSSYKWGHKKTIKSHVTLLRPTIITLQTQQEDYGLSQVRVTCKDKVQKSLNILDAIPCRRKYLTYLFTLM